MAEPLVQALSYSTLAVAAAIGGGLIGVLSIDMVIDGVLIGVSFLAGRPPGSASRWRSRSGSCFWARPA